MLWYKTWIETRWAFVTGMVVLICSASASVITYPQMMKLLASVPIPQFGGVLGDRVKEAVDLAHSFQGYIWSNWFSKNLPQLWTLFAVLVGTGGLAAQNHGGGALYTLSMPVSRNRLLGIRAAIGAAELLAMAFIPSLLIPLLSPSIGESFGVGSVLIYSGCVFIGGSAFYSLTFLLSTIFSDVWRPPLISVGVFLILSLIEQVFRDALPFGVFRLMGAGSYFSNGQLPWLGLLATAALSAAMLYSAMVNIARRDF